ncbi:beta-lactamase-like protein 2 homolog [Toxorhynchites rutilus septentrionalis]|uniref:beta-lactamase-like protein 2 homolog n=1 Tax=Toxorhynchites rutilus septentrionalis TaxID=329112 RepID=UPI002479C854|nr:beta-lactamase-like protein 2 homolog [Toxorhynchites rutilus septentrionalis]
MATIPPVTRLSTRLIRILGFNPSPMTLQGTNTYLIGSGTRRILLDAGDPDVPDYISHLKQVILDEKVIIGDIIVSHWHHDHIGGVDDVLNAIDNNESCRVWKFRRTDAPEPTLENTVCCELKNGQKFEIDGATLEVLHTPGHTTDHIVLLLHEDNSLFSGDCILGEGTTVFEDLYEYIKSLCIIKNTKPTVIYPGHGNVITDPIDRINHYINHRNEREAQILAVLQSNPNVEFKEMDIVKVIYKNTPENLWMAAAYNVNHHLRKLTIERKIIHEHDAWKYVHSASL